MFMCVFMWYECTQPIYTSSWWTVMNHEWQWWSSTDRAWTMKFFTFHPHCPDLIYHSTRVPYLSSCLSAIEVPFGVFGLPELILLLLCWESYHCLSLWQHFLMLICLHNTLFVTSLWTIIIFVGVLVRDCSWIHTFLCYLLHHHLLRMISWV